VLVLLIAITLILLKLGFLLLLVAGPFFLIVGTHPGFGRVVALRWGELLIGVLLKEAAIAIVLSVLLYAYSLIMGTSDLVLPWALKILMISLVTVAVFIYRKPFTHLFSAVGYGVIGSREQADASLARAGSTAARNTRDAATVGVPGFAAYRAARWARRNPAQAAGVAAQIATAGATAGAAGALAGAASAGSPDAQGAEAGAAAAEAGQDAVPEHTASPGAGAAAMGRARAGVNGAPGRTPPPLDLPPRSEEGTARPVSGWARSGSNGPLVAPSQSRARAPGSAGQPAGSAQHAPQQQQARAVAPGPFGGGSHPGGYSGGGYSSGGQSGNGRAPARAAPGPAPRAAPPPSAPPTRRTAPPAAPRAASPPPAAPGAGSPAAGNGSRGDEPAGPTPFWLRPLRRQK
jgi:uncharacterized membrane protein YgcG